VVRVKSTGCFLFAVFLCSWNACFAKKLTCFPDTSFNEKGLVEEITFKKNGTHLVVEGDMALRCDSKGCDKYTADKVVTDGNVKIKKMYFFSSQMDVQIYPDGTYIENMGRGLIYFGKCKGK